MVYLLLRLYSDGGNVWRSFGMILTGKSDVLQENHVSVLNYSQQYPYALVWDRTKPSVVIIWEMLTKTEVLLEETPCQFTRHTASHPTRAVFSKTPLFIPHSLHLCSYCMGKYTTVDKDAACFSQPCADLPESIVYLFTGMCASNEGIP